MEIFYLIGALFLFLLIWLSFHLSSRSRQVHTLKQDLQACKSQEQLNKINLQGKDLLLQDREAQILQLQEILKEKEKSLMDLTSNLASSNTRNGFLSRQLEEQKADMVQLYEKNNSTFQNLANEILEKESAKFTLQNQVNMQNLLQPLGEKIRDFEKRVEENNTLSSKERFSLQREVQRLYELNQTLSQEASNLTRALKADTKKQGNWGEVILERILETSGLQRSIHYLTQDAKQDEEGRLKKPDVTILLPENKMVIIDSKVSLTAYERFCSAEEEPQRQLALRGHLESVRKHVEELSQKDYPSLYEKSADFVLMFIPIEPAYGLALQQDPELYDYAFKRHIIIVSVFTLLATLRMIESMWRLDSQNKNAAEIVRQGSALYDKFVGFADDLKDIGKYINLTQKNYEEALSKLQTGKGNLISSAERMRRLKLNNKKEIPPDFIQPEMDGEE
ncbi:MAG: DNA recombination protein RmuC [Chitinophagaceae bacterium]